jgi:hypothetical protein
VALGDDIETVADRVRLRSENRALAGPDEDEKQNDGDRDGLPAGLLERVDELIRHAPQPKHELDHVAATPETVARRAVALHRMYALAGRRVLLVGDRDLTSLALALVDPTTEIAVADIDDDVLAYIDGQTEAHPTVHSYFADFRLGLPGPLRSWADLVVTDPPYTPGGIGLFVQRGLEGLADLAHGRVALAYGYGDQPKLGLKVQDALHDLLLVYEAVLPAFNRYVGAQAIGSASNLYLLRATSDTKRELARRTTGRRPNIYTHGRQSLEAGAGELGTADLAALHEAAAGPDGLPVVTAVGTAWPDDLDDLGNPRTSGRSGHGSSRSGERSSARNQGADATAPGDTGRVQRTTLAACLYPASPARRPPCSVTDGAIMADLRHDGGPLLVRLLLATRAPRVAVLVRNQHPDTTSAATQHALQATVGDKYALRYRRSFPTPRSAIVEATLVPTEGSTAAAPTARRFVLDRPHGKLGNVAREALITATTPTRAAPLTKNAARTAVADALPTHDLQASLLDLPRHAIDEVLGSLGAIAEQIARGSVLAEGAAGVDGLPVEGLAGPGGGLAGKVDAVGGDVVGMPGDDRQPVDHDGG